MPRAFAWLLLLAAFALSAWVGWWMVPVVAALWGGLRPAVRYPVLGAALSGGLGWGLWLLADWASDPAAFARVGGRVAGVMGMPAWALLLTTLLFAALLAWSAAALAHGLAGRGARRR